MTQSCLTPISGQTVSINTAQKLFSVLSLDIATVFWKVTGFNRLGVGHSMPAGPSARQRSQVHLLL